MINTLFNNFFICIMKVSLLFIPILLSTLLIAKIATIMTTTCTCITYFPQAKTRPISVMNTVLSIPQYTSIATSSILAPGLLNTTSVGTKLHVHVQ